MAANKILQLPRAPELADVALDVPALYNLKSAVLEQVGRLSVRPPLQMSNQPQGTVISLIPSLLLGSPDFWARITGTTPISGVSNQWWYDWTEQLVVSTGNGWTDGPRMSVNSGDTDTRAYNSIEANNTSTGMQGNGVTLPLPGTYKLVPIGIGAIVRIHVEVTTDTGETVYIMDEVNETDGDCSSSSSSSSSSSM